MSMKHFLNRKQLGRHGFIRKGVLLLFSVIFLFPLYWMVCLSFKTQSEASATPFSPPRSFSFDNFKSVLNQIDIAGGMLNSFLYAFAVASLVCVFCTMAAYAIYRMHKRSAKFVERYFVLGLAVPGMCLVVPVFLILKSLGLIGTFWAVVIPCVTGNLATGILLIGAFIKALPKELEEAAAIDGCGSVRCFLKIIVPLLRPGITTRFVLTFLNIWNEYGTFKIFCLGKSRQPITLMIAGFFNSKYALHWGEIGAAILMSSLPAIIMYCICNKQLANAMTIGSMSK